MVLIGSVLIILIVNIFPIQRLEVGVNFKNVALRCICFSDKGVIVPPPGPIQIISVHPGSVSLAWGPPEKWSGPQKFKVTWNGEEMEIDSKLNTSIRNLSPGKKYEFNVFTLGKNNQISTSVSTVTHTGTSKKSFYTGMFELSSSELIKNKLRLRYDINLKMSEMF